MNDVLERILRHHLKVPDDRLRPDTGLGDAGFDSLAVVELSELIGQHLGIEVTDAEITSAETLGHLDRLIEQRIGATA